MNFQKAVGPGDLSDMMHGMSREAKKRMKARVLAALFILLLPAVAAGWDYVIGEGDTLLISVWGEKDLSLSVKVRPDGKITIPAVGEITAANMTPTALQSVITTRLKHIVKTPIVTVALTEITNNKAYVFGGGVTSGVFPLTQRTTLLQLLCQIGQAQSATGTAAGASAASASARNADLKNAYVLRNGKKIKQNFQNLFVSGDISEDIVIEPNDAIFIPAHTDKNVYVMGAVITPKAIEYREGLTVMEAILEAGGFTKFASQNDTVIYRKDGAGEITIPVKVKKLSNGDLSQNAKLKPGDYVVVKEGIF
jgi:polysaccharide export outer membrane protein